MITTYSYTMGRQPLASLGPNFYSISFWLARLFVNAIIQVIASSRLTFYGSAASRTLLCLIIHLHLGRVHFFGRGSERYDRMLGGQEQSELPLLCRNTNSSAAKFTDTLRAEGCRPLSYTVGQFITLSMKEHFRALMKLNLPDPESSSLECCARAVHETR